MPQTGLPAYINAVANSVHTNNVYQATNLSFNTIVNAGSQFSNQQEASEWLADLATANQYAIQKETREKVASGTCRWILEESKFDAWISGDPATFWGVGIPGAGKTVLTSFVIEHLQQRTSPAPNAEGVVLFTYCRYNDNFSFSQILILLLHQLVNCSELARRHVQDTLLVKCRQERTQPSQSDLETNLRAILASMEGGHGFIVMDALDELRDSVRQELVNFLVSLNWSLFLTSRDVELDGLSISTPDIEIRAPDTDFQRFITQEIDRLPKLRSLLKDRKEVLFEVVRSILMKSDGMFLLSALQVATLAGVTTIRSLRKAIQELPTTLTDMYSLTLLRINAQTNEERSLAMRAILWVTHAFQPLKADELLAALSVEPDSTELDPEAIADEKTLISICCGLLTINDKVGVRLIHYTAHHFFLDHHESPFDDPHTFAATICAVYREHARIDDPPVTSQGELEQFTKDRQCAFAAYTFRHLGRHAYHSTLRHNGDIPQPVWQFLVKHSSSLALPFPFDSFEYPNYFYDSGTASHFAAFHGLLRWFQQPPTPTTINSLSVKEITPLAYASGGGSIHVVVFLLGTGVVDINTYRHRQFSALFVAIRQRNLWMVEVLLNFGASPDGALAEASELGLIRIATLLLRHPQTKTNEQDDRGRSALHAACSRGSINIAQLLVASPGIDINLRDKIRESTPLHLAAEAGHVSLVRILLNSPAVLYNAKDRDGRTALHYAALNGLEEIVQMLIDTPDFDVDAKDWAGRTALHSVCIGGHAASLSILLGSKKLDINLPDENGWTALHHSSFKGRTECVQALLECGSTLRIDVRTVKDRWGDARYAATALDLILQRYPKSAIVTLLEEAGAHSANDS